MATVALDQSDNRADSQGSFPGFLSWAGTAARGDDCSVAEYFKVTLR